MLRFVVIVGSLAVLFWGATFVLSLFPPDDGLPRTEHALDENFRLTTMLFDDAGRFSSGNPQNLSFKDRRTAFTCLYADMEIFHSARARNTEPDLDLYQEHGLCGASTEAERMSIMQKLADTERYDHIVTLVYVHGWKGNASAENSNHIQFRESVATLAKSLNASLRKSSDKGKILVNGVFLGWSGARTRYTKAETVFFFKSKQIADDVSRGHMNLVLQLLDRYYRDSREKSIKHNLITIGHSFGARIVYNMTSDILYSRVLLSASDNSWDDKVRRAREPYSLQTQDTQNRTTIENYQVSKPVQGFGDLVVLLNPAFEAARYRLLDDLHTTINFSDQQQPLLYTVSSGKDTATNVAFPLSRYYEVTFRNRARPVNREQKTEMREAVGNYELFRTHLIDFGESQHMDNSSASALVEQNISNEIPEGCESGSASLVSVREEAVDSPFIIAFDEDGELMKNHNDIFNPCVSQHLSDIVVNRVRAAY